MPVRGRSRWERCHRCTLRSDLCLCAELPRVHNVCPVVVVMHATEMARPSGTARLLELCLSQYQRCVVGQRDLPFEGLPALPDNAPPYLLYPDSSGIELTRQSRALLPARISLIVPDGTWSQARRLFHRHPSLYRLPRLGLPPAVSSGYGLRRNQRPGGVCTAEAVAAALGVLEEPAYEEQLRSTVAEFSRRVLAARRGERPSASMTVGAGRSQEV